MKILIVLKNMDHQRGLPGGVGNANEEIAKQLRKLGNKVDFLSREDDLKKYSLVNSILPLRKEIKKLMEKEDYDVIYTQDWTLTLPLLFPSRILKKETFCMFLWTSGKFSNNHAKFNWKNNGKKINCYRG